MPSNSFYVVLPSNTNVEGNRTNSFRVRLPRKLQFNSDWEVGLGVIVYPHSWPSLGTNEEQFVQMEWQTGESVYISVPASNVTNPNELSKSLYNLLGDGNEPLAKKTRTAQLSYMHASSAATNSAKVAFVQLKHESGETPLRTNDDTNESYSAKITKYLSSLKDEDKKILEELYKQKLEKQIANLHSEDLEIYNSTKDRGGFEVWIQAYRKARFACQLKFYSSMNRFMLHLDPRYVKRVRLSDQLSYILGFDTTEFVEAVNEAKFMPDMRGDVSTFHVYAPDLIEPMMIGDVTAPVLRMVTIRGAPDEMIEEQFLAIQYHRLLLKEISELFIEIRTHSGGLMPFQYGTCTLTLHFRKCAYF